MSKYDYLHALYQELISLDVSERSAIMRDVENKFREAEDQGLSELSVTNVLGTPAQYAAQVLLPAVEKEVVEDDTLISSEDADDIDSLLTSDEEQPLDDIPVSSEEDMDIRPLLDEDAIEEIKEPIKPESKESTEKYTPSIDLSSSLIIGHDTELVRAKDLVDPEDLMDEQPQRTSSEDEAKPLEVSNVEEKTRISPDQAAIQRSSKPANEKPQKTTPSPSSLQVRRARPPQQVRRPRVQPVTKYQEPQRQPQKVYTTPYPIQKKTSANHPIKMLAIALGMFFFNLTFALGPFIAVWSVVITLVATGFAVALAGVGVLLSAFLSIPMAFVSVPIVLVNHPILLFCFGFLLLGAGGLLSIATIYSVRFFGMLTARYAGWNVRLIRGY